MLTELRPTLPRRCACLANSLLRRRVAIVHVLIRPPVRRDLLSVGSE